MPTDWSEVYFGKLAEGHELIKGRPKVREPFGEWLLKRPEPKLEVDYDIDDADVMRRHDYHLGYLWRRGRGDWGDYDVTANDIEQFFRANTAFLETETPGPNLDDFSSDLRPFPTVTPDTSGQPPQTTRITAGTLLQEALDHLTQNSGISDITDQLTSSLIVSEYPVFTGGQADVYCATRSDGVRFAVKCLRHHNNKQVKHTAREISTWSKLKHHHILELSGLAVFRNCLTMVSPWMEYGSVTSALNEWPQLDRYTLCQQLANVVDYLHEHEVVHGDLKGANVLVAPDGTIRLTDFGLAILHNQTLQFSTTTIGGGTVQWMAPELLVGSGLCYETDVYAMGMTMLEIITGEMPFPEISTFFLLLKAVYMDRRTPSVAKLQTEPPSPKAQKMVEVLHRCWKYDPKERASAHEVTALMEELGDE